jgi:hypothetical protein
MTSVNINLPHHSLLFYDSAVVQWEANHGEEISNEELLQYLNSIPIMTSRHDGSEMTPEQRNKEHIRASQRYFVRKVLIRRET